ncbi:PEPxxWA-CTERM sorting domain-containing protein [Sandarakinorhabdus oryzae]|uniref:PEPxxWA-CTERM sorting domain-containing protein n=1 Tax=Sandarakinorhabdus oryzae TaxID=2675220 RepID=UPI001F1DA79D|nr:PEPxxWA-CTERM sorting domain-containing protein [Sandarakinorhabdus oryzae]
MKSFRSTGGLAMAMFAAVALLADAPATAASVSVSANAGNYPALPSNMTVYTDQHSINNRLPGAGSLGDLVRTDNGLVTFVGPGSHSPRWAISASEPQSSARAYGDLSTGKVGAYAATTPSGFASSSAIISDTLTFAIAGAGASTITPLRMLLTLHAETPDAHGAFVFQAGTGKFLVLGDLATPYYSTNSGLSHYNTWVEGSTRFFDVVLDLEGANPTFGVEMTLEAIASLGSTSDFYNTAGLQFLLPQGMTYTSQSGVFLTATGVPEPATWAMLVAGFGLVGAISRRRVKPVAA